MERTWRGIVVGGSLVAVSPLVLVLSVVLAGTWWDGPEVDVPRDGRTHEVRLDRPGGDYALWTHSSKSEPACLLTDERGEAVDVTRVPDGARTGVEMQGAGPPQASSLFAAPADGLLVVTCDDTLGADAPPTTSAITVGVGTAPRPLLYGLANWGTLLVGPAVGLLGVGVLGVTAVAVLRGRSHRPGPGRAPGRGPRGTAPGPR